MSGRRLLFLFYFISSSLLLNREGFASIEGRCQKRHSSLALSVFKGNGQERTRAESTKTCPSRKMSWDVEMGSVIIIIIIIITSTLLYASRQKNHVHSHMCVCDLTLHITWLDMCWRLKTQRKAVQTFLHVSLPSPTTFRFLVLLVNNHTGRIDRFRNYYSHLDRRQTNALLRMTQRVYLPFVHAC